VEFAGYQYDTFKEANDVASAAVLAVVKHPSDSLKKSLHVAAIVQWFPLVIYTVRGERYI
jgi:hypothetical protein